MTTSTKNETALHAESMPEGARFRALAALRAAETFIAKTPNPPCHHHHYYNGWCGRPASTFMVHARLGREATTWSCEAHKDEFLSEIDNDHPDANANVAKGIRHTATKWKPADSPRVELSRELAAAIRSLLSGGDPA